MSAPTIDTGWVQPPDSSLSEAGFSTGSTQTATVNSLTFPDLVANNFLPLERNNSSPSLATHLEECYQRLSVLRTPERNRKRALSDPLSPTDTDSNIDCCPSPASPCATPDSRSSLPLSTEDIQRLYELVTKLYVDKNLLAIDMQEKITASELQRTKAEASAASFKVEALLWKQRSTTLEENLSHTTARLQEMEQVLMAHDKVVSEHQRWIQKKQTIESENIASISSVILKIIKFVFVVLVLVAMIGVDPHRLLWIEYFSETYSGM